MKTKLFLGVSTLFLATVCNAQYMFEPPLQPTTYSSPNGTYKLWINPSQANGAGQGFYRLSTHGKTIWQKTLPFSLKEAVVNDKGFFGGYAYSKGPDINRNYGDFEVAIVSPKGEVKLLEKWKQGFSQMMHAPPQPWGKSIYLHPDNDQMVIDVHQEGKPRHPNSAWHYDLSKAKFINGFDPSVSMDEDSRWVISSTPINGTPFTLLHWWTFNGSVCGAIFSLVDKEYHSIWKLSLPSDYQLKGNDDASEDFRNKISEKKFVWAEKDSRFSVWQVAKAQRTAYEVKKVGNLWSVHEVDSKPYKEPSVAEPKNLAAPTVTLKPIRTLRLPVSKATNSPLESLDAFDYHRKDQIVFLRSSNPPAIVVMKPNGSHVRTIKMPFSLDLSDQSCTFTWAGENQYVVILSGSEKDAVSKAWRVNSETGSIAPMPAFASYSVEAATGLPDGRFAILSHEYTRYTINDGISFHAADGKQLWVRSSAGGYSGKEDEIFSPQDITFDSKGQLLVLNNVSNVIQLFDIGGKFLSAIHLDKLWKGENHYPTNVAALPNGGIIVNDFGAENPIVKLDSQHRITGSMGVHYRDKKNVDYIRDLQVDPTGNIWILNNDNNLLRLDKSGIIDSIFGYRTPSDGLNSISQLEVAVDGKVYALDSKTAAVHAFDSKGKALFVARPQATDYKERPPEINRFEIGYGGDIFLSGSLIYSEIHFTKDGRRIGANKWDHTRGFMEKDPNWIWPWGEHRLSPTEAKKTNDIDRWPNQDWIKGGFPTFEFAIAPDNRVAVISIGVKTGNPPQNRIAFYTAQGKPIKMAALNGVLPHIDSTAYNGQRMFVLCGSTIYAFDTDGKVRWKAYLPSNADSYEIFPTSDGFAAYDYKGTIYWFKAS